MATSLRSIDLQTNDKKGCRTSALRCQSFAVAAAMCVAVASGLHVSAAHAAALVSAFGGAAQTNDTGDIFATDAGGRSASAQAGDSGGVGSWSADASVFSYSSGTIELKALAAADRLSFSHVSLTPGGAARIPAAATFARWTDTLQFENSDILDARAFTGFFVYFRPVVAGTIVGHARAQFDVTVDDRFGRAIFDNPGEHLLGFNYRISALDLRLGFIGLVMTLQTSAFTISALDSAADFSNTAVLPPLVLADANGNFVPGTEELRIVGSSGFEYATQVGLRPAGVVSEPATLALLALGWLSVLGLCRGRHSQPH